MCQLAQETRTADFKEVKEWSCSQHYKSHQPTQRLRYRMITEEAGYPLANMRGTYELVNATLCVIQGIV